MMALTNAQKQAALRKRRAAIGLTKAEYYLTACEKIKVKAFIKKMREQ